MAPGGSIINFSSITYMFGAAGMAPYVTANAGIMGMTRALAREWGPHNIRVNAVAPGAIERIESPRPAELVAKFVEMTALGRVGLPEDIAKAVRFLASEEASFITGEILNVSGGYRL